MKFFTNRKKDAHTITTSSEDDSSLKDEIFVGHVVVAITTAIQAYHAECIGGGDQGHNDKGERRIQVIWNLLNSVSSELGAENERRLKILTLALGILCCDSKDFKQHVVNNLTQKLNPKEDFWGFTAPIQSIVMKRFDKLEGSRDAINEVAEFLNSSNMQKNCENLLCPVLDLAVPSPHVDLPSDASCSFSHR